MKVQCDVCEKAAATLLCCADEAALCAECDKQVHAANKLAGKHERVPFIGQQPASCDICQEKLGHFFCVEDRALLCRLCDVSIHTANKLVGKHKRFLVSGVQVALSAMLPQVMVSPPQSSPPLPLICKSPQANPIANTETTQQIRIPTPHEAQCKWPPPSLVVCKANFVATTHASVQNAQHSVQNPQASAWPSPLIPASALSHHQVVSPPTTHISDCLAHLDALLNSNSASTFTSTFTETPSRRTNPSLGWDLPNNTLAWNQANASTYLFEDSLAQVPSTPSPSIEYQASFKCKRASNDELTHSTFDHTLLVPQNSFPSLKKSKISFYGGGIEG